MLQVTVIRWPPAIYGSLPTALRTRSACAYADGPLEPGMTIRNSSPPYRPAES